MSIPSTNEVLTASRQGGESAKSRRKVTIPINVLLIGGLALFLCAAVVAIIAYWLRMNTGRKKSADTGMQLVSEIKHLTSAIHPSISATSTELWESTIDTLRQKPCVSGKLSKGCSSSRTYRTSSVASSITSGGLNSKLLKSKGSVSRQDQSQVIHIPDYIS